MRVRSSDRYGRYRYAKSTGDRDLRSSPQISRFAGAPMGSVIGYRATNDKRQTTKYENKQAMDAGRHPDSMRRKFYFV